MNVSCRRCHKEFEGISGQLCAQCKRNDEEDDRRRRDQEDDDRRRREQDDISSWSTPSIDLDPFNDLGGFGGGDSGGGGASGDW